MVEQTSPGYWLQTCLLYTSDAADDGYSVDLGGRRIIKKIFFKQKTAYEISEGLVGSEMCIRDSKLPCKCKIVSPADLEGGESNES